MLCAAAECSNCSSPGSRPAFRPFWLQVKGYCRILFCQSVRDDVDGALGSGAWAGLLPRMCEGRLVPTPWLNKVRSEAAAQRPTALSCAAPSLVQPPPWSAPQAASACWPLTSAPTASHGHRLCLQDFREPLYLLDKPVRLEDTRTEEEKRYPELFRCGEGLPTGPVGRWVGGWV